MIKTNLLSILLIFRYDDPEDIYLQRWRAEESAWNHTCCYPTGRCEDNLYVLFSVFLNMKDFCRFLTDFPQLYLLHWGLHWGFRKIPTPTRHHHPDAGHPRRLFREALPSTLHLRQLPLRDSETCQGSSRERKFKSQNEIF